MKTFPFLLAFISSAGLVSASPVLFTSANFPQLGGDYSILDASGAILEAPSFTSSPLRAAPYFLTNPNPTATLNGIVFTPVPYVANVSGAYYTTNGAGVDNGRTSGTDYVTSNDLYDLSYDVLRTGNNDTNLTVNLQNLAIGQPYKVQFIFSADNLGGSRTDRQVKVAAGAFTPTVSWNTSGTGSDGLSDLLTYGPTSGVGLVTAVFTADSTSELFTMLSNTTFSGQGNSRVSLAGMVISTVAPTFELKILSSSFSFNDLGGTASLTFSSQAGKSYAVTTSTDLVNWTQVGLNLTGNAGQTQTDVPFLPGSMHFFRVETRP